MLDSKFFYRFANLASKLVSYVRIALLLYFFPLDDQMDEYYIVLFVLSGSMDIFRDYFDGAVIGGSTTVSYRGLNSWLLLAIVPLLYFYNLWVIVLTALTVCINYNAGINAAMSRARGSYEDISKFYLSSSVLSLVFFVIFPKDLLWFIGSLTLGGVISYFIVYRTWIEMRFFFPPITYKVFPFLGTILFGFVDRMYAKSLSDISFSSYSLAIVIFSIPYIYLKLEDTLISKFSSKRRDIFRSIAKKTVVICCIYIILLFSAFYLLEHWGISESFGENFVRMKGAVSRYFWMPFFLILNPLFYRMCQSQGLYKTIIVSYTLGIMFFASMIWIAPGLLLVPFISFLIILIMSVYADFDNCRLQYTRS